MKSRWLFLGILFLLHFLGAQTSVFATEEFARQTGKACAFCHHGSQGGPLNATGMAFVRNHYAYPIPESTLRKAHQLSTPFHRTFRFILGYVHLAAACILIGAIFYVHLFVKPKSLSAGIPKGERRLGLTCMGALLVTGAYLTWHRIDSPAAFFKSDFGILLFIKLLLFTLMATLALLAVTRVHRRLRKTGAARLLAGPEGFRLEDLSRYDGKEGRPAYFLYKNVVYRCDPQLQVEGRRPLSQACRRAGPDGGPGRRAPRRPCLCRASRGGYPLRGPAPGSQAKNRRRGQGVRGNGLCQFRARLSHFTLRGRLALGVSRTADAGRA